MGGQPASKPNPGYVISVSRKFVMPSTSIIKNIPYGKVGNILQGTFYMHTHTDNLTKKYHRKRLI